MRQRQAAAGRQTVAGKPAVVGHIQIGALGSHRQARSGDPRRCTSASPVAPIRDEDKPSIASAECDAVARDASRQSAPKAAPEPQLTTSARRPEVSSNPVVEAWAVRACLSARWA